MIKDTSEYLRREKNGRSSVARGTRAKRYAASVGSSGDESLDEGPEELDEGERKVLEEVAWRPCRAHLEHVTAVECTSTQREMEAVHGQPHLVVPEPGWHAWILPPRAI